MGVRCFWVEPTDQQDAALRRYRSGSTDKCCPDMPGAYSYHQAQAPVGRLPVAYTEDGYVQEVPASAYDGDERWPTHCSCGYQFAEEDGRHVFTSHIYRRPDTGQEYTLRDVPAGAMWNAHWMRHRLRADGRCIVVRLPDGHDWTIDSEASNCTRKGTDHDCWCRHGEPPNLTVDKVPEPGRSTCQAGAGSIASPSGWHGFLRGGELVA